MKNSDMSEKGERKTRQAKFPLENLRIFVGPEEEFEEGGISLIMEGSHGVMQCTKCGETWDVNATIEYGLMNVQVFLPWELGYRFFYTCPLGCNKAYRWMEDIQWILTCEYQQAERC